MRFRSHCFHESDLIAQVHGTRLRSRHAATRTKLRFGERSDVARVRQHVGFDRQPAQSWLELWVGSKAGSYEALDIVRNNNGFRRAHMFLASRADSAFAIDCEHTPVHFIHSRIHADEHARIGNRDAARHRGKIGNTDCRKTCAERESLHNTDRDAHACERAGSTPIGNTVELVQREPCFAQDLINHRQHELGMPTCSFHRTLDNPPLNAQRHGASLSRSVDRENLHIRTIMRIVIVLEEQDTLAKRAKIAKEDKEISMENDMDENEIGKTIVGVAIHIHRELGPGLLESVYETILVYELRNRGFQAERQVSIPIRYRDLAFQEGFRADVLVNRRVIVELKCVEKLSSAHRKQLLTYLRLAGLKLGFLLNFGEYLMKNGVVRTVNGLDNV